MLRFVLYYVAQRTYTRILDHQPHLFEKTMTQDHFLSIPHSMDDVNLVNPISRSNTFNKFRIKESEKCVGGKLKSRYKNRIKGYQSIDYAIV